MVLTASIENFLFKDLLGPEEPKSNLCNNEADGFDKLIDGSGCISYLKKINRLLSTECPLSTTKPMVALLQQQVPGPNF